MGSPALQGLPIGGASQTLRIPVLRGWTTCPEMLIKAPVSTWAPKRGAEGISADSEAVAALWGPPGDPCSLLPFSHALGPAPRAPLLRSAQLAIPSAGACHESGKGRGRSGLGYCPLAACMGWERVESPSAALPLSLSSTLECPLRVTAWLGVLSDGQRLLH